MKPQSSAWGQAVEGILALFKTSNPGVQLWDGPNLSDDMLEDEAVLVGNGAPAGMVQRQAPDFGGRVREDGRVICAITVYSGNGGMQPVRDRVNAILAAFESALRADPTMDGRVDDSMVGPDGEWHQTQTPDGTVCAFGFTVDYEAYI